MALAPAQLLFMAGFFLIFGFSLWFFGDRRTLPFLGIGTALVGLSFSVQQLFLYELVNRVGSRHRKEYHLAAAGTLLSLGIGILCLSGGRLLQGEGELALEVAESAAAKVVAVKSAAAAAAGASAMAEVTAEVAASAEVVLAKASAEAAADKAAVKVAAAYFSNRAGLFFLGMFPFPFTALLLSFFYPGWFTSGRGKGWWREFRDTDGRFGNLNFFREWLFVPWFVFTARIPGRPGSNEESLMPSVLLAGAWVILCIFSFLVMGQALVDLGVFNLGWFDLGWDPKALAGEFSGYYLESDAGLLHAWGVVVSLFFFLLAAALAVRVRIHCDREFILTGQDQLLGFVFLFISPFGFQGIFLGLGALRLEPWVQALIVLLLSVFLFGLLWGLFGRGVGRSRLLAFLIDRLLGRGFHAREFGREEREHRFNQVVWGCFVSALILACLGPFAMQSYPVAKDFPWIFLSYLFLALGCAGNTVLDLWDATTAFDKLRYSQLLGDAHRSLTHEVINGLRPVDTLVNHRFLDRAFAGEPLWIDYSDQREDVVRLCQSARTGLRHVKEMVANFRDYQTFLSRSVGERASLSAFVGEAVARFRREPDPRSWSVSFHPGEDCHFKFDGLSLFQSLRILLDNAVEASQSGRMNEIRVSVRRLGERWAIVEVVDRGIGMDAQARADFGWVGFTSKPEGRGIGAVTAQAFVTAMGGELAVVRSEPGEGSTIQIRLPVG
ncbi:MAG: hypothetical protein HQL59_00790 [Magnetococcales bacterium]|nr:hypothetical protein [Magnetococcales bacterium]